MSNDKNMASLKPDILRIKLGQSLFAPNIVFHETVDSTNTLLKDLAACGAPEGTVVIAEEQTGGRGRMGRAWLSPGHLNLYLSLLLRPSVQPDQVFVLTMVMALATIDGVEKVSGLGPMIKWPNDLYVDGRKLGGILTELSVKDRAVEYVVLGLGLNVNRNPGEEQGVLYPATSVFKETGRKISRNGLLVEILISFEDYYGRVLAGNIAEIYDKWNERSMLLGKQVEIKTTGGSLFGRALKIDRKGALVIEDDNGKEQTILNGDVSVKF
jgi:BirA family transcriptional regulator, biotin operon repressor / biotin---[acetyl-CoA-carboxylase] ligase